MNVNIKISVSDVTVTTLKSNIVYELSKEVNAFFLSKSYGENVKTIEIGFLMVLERPGYEDWYKPKLLTYTDYKKTKHKLTGEVIEIEKTLKYEIKFNDEQLINFTGGNDILSREILAAEILNSLSNLDKLPKKVKDFDKEKFRADMEQFFKEQKIM